MLYSMRVLEIKNEHNLSVDYSKGLDILILHYVHMNFIN